MAFLKNSKQVQYIKDLKGTFESERGQRVLENWLQNYILSTRIDFDNTSKSAFMEGERNFVLKLLRDLEVNPTELQKKIDNIKHNL